MSHGGIEICDEEVLDGVTRAMEVEAVDGDASSDQHERLMRWGRDQLKRLNANLIEWSSCVRPEDSETEVAKWFCQCSVEGEVLLPARWRGGE